MTAKQRVRAPDVVRGLVRAVPRMHIAARGLWRLAMIRPGQRQSIGTLVEKWAAKRPTHTAVADANGAYTYAELNRQANRIAGLLRRAGVRRGSRVGLLMENRIDLLAAAAGTVKLGAAGVMLNHHQHGEVLAHSLAITDPTVLIVGAECRDAFDSVREQLPESLAGAVYWLADSAADEPIPGCHDLAAELALETDVNPSETATVTTSDAAFHVLTSGTTGMPKAAIMSHGRWLKACNGVGLASLGMSRDDVFYCPLPLYHNNALTLSWGAALGAGATLALARKFSASRFWDDVHHFRATAFSYIGELCRYLLVQPRSPKERTHRVRVVLGNGLRPELWQAFRERFGIRHINEFYGASECNLLFTNVFDVQPSCGFTPFPYAVVACDPDTEEPLRDARGRLRRVRPGEAGLLLSKVTRRSPFDGYTSRRESEKKLLHDAFRSGDCWFNTGDLVRRMGWRHVQFVDRLGDTFRWKGENVATTEVEQVLNGFPQVHEGVVYGVQVPGHEGRAGMAAITLAGGAELDCGALAAYLAERLPSYAVPLFIRLRDSHTTTSTFKHQKHLLKREGFDPRVVGEPLFVYDESGGTYRPLTPERYQAIIEEGQPRRSGSARRGTGHAGANLTQEQALKESIR